MRRISPTQKKFLSALSRFHEMPGVPCTSSRGLASSTNQKWPKVSYKPAAGPDGLLTHLECSVSSLVGQQITYQLDSEKGESAWLHFDFVPSLFLELEVFGKRGKRNINWQKLVSYAENCEWICETREPLWHAFYLFHSIVPVSFITMEGVLVSISEDLCFLSDCSTRLRIELNGKFAGLYLAKCEHSFYRLTKDGYGILEGGVKAGDDPERWHPAKWFVDRGWVRNEARLTKLAGRSPGIRRFAEDSDRVRLKNPKLQFLYDEREVYKLTEGKADSVR